MSSTTPPRAHRQVKSRDDAPRKHMSKDALTILRDREHAPTHPLEVFPMIIDSSRRRQGPTATPSATPLLPANRGGITRRTPIDPYSIGNRIAEVQARGVPDPVLSFSTLPLPVVVRTAGPHIIPELVSDVARSGRARRRARRSRRRTTFPHRRHSRTSTRADVGRERPR